MGTIGDLLGDALGQALASNSEAAPIEAIEGAREQAVEERAKHVRQVVQDALVSNASVVPENIDDACLLSALDLDTLSLYAAVSTVEHELAISIPDAVVSQWVTVGDIASSVGELVR
ncbi:acyl carrier protein [Actinomyces sp. oral taxon 181]|uniref:acyl carrier protein n=1 Tax=Actinomyces sp. oral taxon 181 TaxID=712121 RepID=UPI0025C6B8E6|nr:acyl carrier protein [Actinomyces sp. oral taxon 181]MBS5750127.1 acyl carrier protein [Actinomyces sp. oral taxon 181]